jgi:hypothetical protein
MPIIQDIDIKMDYEDMLRRQGMSKSSNVRPQLTSEIKELCKLESFLKPSIAFESFTVKQVSINQLSLDNGEVFVNSKIVSTLAAANRIVAVICTIGPMLEAQVAKFLAQEEQLKAFLLDGIGSAAIDSLGTEACNRIQALNESFEVSSPLSPGMENISIQEQSRIFRMADAERIGVSINSAGMLIPRKSISMILGVGKKMPTWHRAEVCNRCNIRDTCQHRIQS